MTVVRRLCAQDEERKQMTRRWSYVLPAAIAACSMAFVSTASAQAYETPSRAPAPAQAGPNADLVGVGIFTIALPYFASVGVAMGSEVDHDLYIPVAGPWLDLAHRPECGSYQYSTCNSDMEPFYKVLLIEDGILQGIGALEMLAGLASTSPAHRTEAARPSKPTLRVAPAPVGRSGYGIGAVGTF
jgi:hypothetical protein